MAKSFFKILKEKVIEILHQGNKEVFDLPAWLLKAEPYLEDEEKLVQWAYDNEVIHGIMHLGIQQLLIAIRAKARPQVKIYADLTKITEKEEDGWIIDRKTGEVTRSIIEDKVNAQKRIDEYVLKPVIRPGLGGTAVTKALAIQRESLRSAMETAGISEEKIEAAITNLK